MCHTRGHPEDFQFPEDVGDLGGGKWGSENKTPGSFCAFLAVSVRVLLACFIWGQRATLFHPPVPTKLQNG